MFQNGLTRKITENKIFIPINSQLHQCVHAFQGFACVAIKDDYFSY